MNWNDIPLEDFGEKLEVGEDGRTTGRRYYPHGEGQAQDLLRRLGFQIERIYEDLVREEDEERFEGRAEILLIRDGREVYENVRTLKLKDLPAVLDAFVILEEEQKQRIEEEEEHKAIERKNRNRILSKERRKLKKLGEW